MIPVNTVLSKGTLEESALLSALLGRLEKEVPDASEEWVEYCSLRDEVADALTDIAHAQGCTLCGQRMDEYKERLTLLLWEGVIEVIEDYTPPFCNIGMHPGDGSLLGCWVNRESLQAAVGLGHVLQVNSVVDYLEKWHLNRPMRAPYHGTFRFIWVTGSEFSMGDRLYLVSPDKWHSVLVWDEGKDPDKKNTNKGAAEEGKKVLIELTQAQVPPASPQKVEGAA